MRSLIRRNGDLDEGRSGILPLRRAEQRDRDRRPDGRGDRLGEADRSPVEVAQDSRAITHQDRPPRLLHQPHGHRRAHPAGFTIPVDCPHHPQDALDLRRMREFVIGEAPARAVDLEDHARDADHELVFDALRRVETLVRLARTERVPCRDTRDGERRAIRHEPAVPGDRSLCRPAPASRDGLRRVEPRVR